MDSGISSKNFYKTAEKCEIYHSVKNKTKQLADTYAETDQLSHRYLSYRDIPSLLAQYLKGNRALDYGTGTGISADFLKKLRLDVTGADIDPVMLEKAREDFPDINFVNINKLIPKNQFDLIFSCFVLFDMKSKEEIIKYLENASSFMRKSGIIVVITGSEELYSFSSKWIAFDSHFEENQTLKSGDIARLRLKYPSIEFYDYFWKETDYFDCFQNAKLKILKIHKPKGSESDPYLWEDEKEISPYTIYILEKQKS